MEPTEWASAFLFDRGLGLGVTMFSLVSLPSGEKSYGRKRRCLCSFEVGLRLGSGAPTEICLHFPPGWIVG